MRTKTYTAVLAVLALGVAAVGCTTVADPPAPTPSTGATQTPAPASPSEATKPEQGVFRSYPFEPDDTFELGDWELTLGETDLDATQDVIDYQLAEYGGDESYTTPPSEGNVYITVAVTATYKGNTRGDPYDALTYAYISADGHTYNSIIAVEFEEDLSYVGELYAGATGKGTVLQEVPQDGAEGGYWRVTETAMDSAAGDVYVASEIGQNDGDEEIALDGTPCVYVDDVCFSQSELDALAEEKSGVGEILVDDYLAFTADEQAAINSDLEAAGKFAEWGIANPLTGPCAAQTDEGVAAQTLIEMGFGPGDCPND
ncbi:hypothetical protein [Promicromonospora sukumoe]